MDADTLLTSGEIAKLLNADPGLVRHVLASRRIAHIGRAGQTRIFAPETIEKVRLILDSMETRRRREPALT